MAISIMVTVNSTQSILGPCLTLVVANVPDSSNASGGYIGDSSVYIGDSSVYIGDSSEQSGCSSSSGTAQLPLNQFSVKCGTSGSVTDVSESPLSTAVPHFPAR